jgi:hypothetical protein
MRRKDLPSMFGAVPHHNGLRDARSDAGTHWYSNVSSHVPMFLRHGRLSLSSWRLELGAQPHTTLRLQEPVAVRLAVETPLAACRYPRPSNEANTAGAAPPESRQAVTDRVPRNCTLTLP